MTINKVQGQTLDFVGIYLREPVFSHGQLYVALSRAKSSNYVKVLIRPSMLANHDDHSTYNIVYDEIIQGASFQIGDEVKSGLLLTSSSERRKYQLFFDKDMILCSVIMDSTYFDSNIFYFFKLILALQLR
ncbi:uncharacterized protein LOC107816665 [Nicotiana tabacum]|uniref:Uncharacterized protein LOC107816665 n=7 Tax=Nicotiana tabacum TaxID=4097 RepID=A0AC58UL31_TOBAC